tara:strand:- start:4274 stop:5413 length:1140 start_codon:yes stop_codon:yes gene_type:complete
LKVVFISNAFLPEKNSAAVQLSALKSEFCKHGHEVKVFTTKVFNRQKHEDIYEAFVPFLKSRNLLLRTLGEFLLSPIFFISFYFQIKRYNPDLIVFYSPSIFFGPFVSLFKRNTTICLILRDIFPEWAARIGLIKSTKILNFFKYFSSLQYKAADHIAYESEQNIQYLEKYNINKKLFRLNNWLGDRIIDHTKVPHKYCKNLSDKKIIIYAGTIGHAQGVDNFKRFSTTIAKDKDYHFLMVAHGLFLEELKKFVFENSITNISFKDPVPAEEIEELLESCYLGYISLQDELDNIPGKFITYLRAGIPVFADISSDNALNKIIPEEKVGFIGCKNQSKDNFYLEKIKDVETYNEYSINCKKLHNLNYSAFEAYRNLLDKM